MMSVKDQLISLGWSIKAEFFEGNKQRIEEVKRQLLDSDLRQTGEKFLPEMAKLDQITKPYIVQLHKTRNVTAPKDNEASSHRPHLYRLTITDGHVFQNALILPSLRNFNLDTPPGVKLLLKAKTKISNGFYVLNDQTCEVLGGTVTELVQKWKLNKLMGKHVRTLIGEGAPPPWVPFGTKNTTTVDTSQRSMDVAKMQQANEEDPEFVRQRRAAIDTLLTGQVSKTERFARQDVIKGRNLAKGFEQISQRMPTERPNTAAAAAASSSSVSNKPTNIAAAAAAIKANTRLPEWAKNQIADDPIEDDKRRPQSDRKQPSRRNFDDDDDRPKRGGGFGRNRRGRGRGDDDDGGEETRPTKDVTLFDFFGMHPKPTTQKPPSTSKTQNIDSKPTQSTSASNQPRISSAVQKQIFGFENGDQVLARYHEDNEYYPAVVMNIMYNTQKCAVMFEGYDSQETVSFDDVEPFEEGYYNEEEEEYEQEQVPPPPSSSQRNNASVQHQQPPQQQRNQPAYQQDQSGYGYYNQQRDNQNRNRPNSGRGYPQQQYPNQYNNNYYH